MNRIFLLALAALLASGGTALADPPLTDCVIYVHNASSSTCAGAAAVSSDLAAKEQNNTWFTDHDQPANMIAGRCIERAAEFLSWCGGDYAFSVYRVQGHNVIGTGANSSGKAYISDGIGRWTAFHN